MRIIVFSSLPADSGCFLRAKYLSSAISFGHHQVKLVPEPKGISFLFHMSYSFFRNLIILLFSRAQVGICIKPYPNTLWPLLIRKFFQPKFIVVTDIDDLDYGYRKGLIPLLSKIIQLPFPRFCDLVTYHNDNLLTHIQKEFKVSAGKMYRLDQGVDFSIYGKGDRAKSSQIRKEMIVKSGLKNPILLAYSAHLNIASDLDDILLAFKTILIKQKNIFLVIAGGGPMLGAFIKLVDKEWLSSHTHFTGQLSPSDVAATMFAADFALVYYKDKKVNYFRTSMKIRECLALGMNVITNDVGDLKEFKPYTFQSKTSCAEYAKTILNVISAPKKALNRRAIAYIRKKYDWSIIGPAFAGFLEKLVGEVK